MQSAVGTELRVPPAGTARKNSSSEFIHSGESGLSALCGIFRKEPHVTGSVGRLQTPLCDTVKHKALGQIFYMLKKHSCSKGKQSQPDLRYKCVKLQKMCFSVVKVSQWDQREKVRICLSVNCLLLITLVGCEWEYGGCSQQDKNHEN